MKLTVDGTVAYADFRESEKVDPLVAIEEAKLKEGVHYVEIYQRCSSGESVRDQWLSTWRVIDGVRMKP